jgi:hypothetical protein
MTDEGKFFKIKTTEGTVVMKCTEHTPDRRILEVGGAWIELDWMEFLDQKGLGRIVELSEGVTL